ncbi:transmembrane protein 179B-like [Dipodomys merriami]|uniref:transmembrane protein 179B-like n=1 Tax=Dipodomys merriami TaxID=94247 RepID=UPI00385571F3
MAGLCLHCVEFVLFAACSVCGAVAAVSMAWTQVWLRDVGQPSGHGRRGFLAELWCRCPIGVYIGLPISAIAAFLILVTACVLRYGTSSLCDSIISQKHTISCSEAQKIPWTPPGMALQFYSNLQNAETSSWVNLVLWCVVLVLQIIQCNLKSSQCEPLENNGPQETAGEIFL